jgi:phosphoribosylformylglycinamidine (FGAM) synthase PurS component
MGRQIKGISVRIDAETKGLNAALKDVRSESNKIGRELYKVNRGLRFSPKSTELLSQKQKLLKNRIDSTTKELNALKQSQDEVEKKFKKGEIDDKQYREFKRDIVQAESKLDTFNNQLKQTNRQARNAKFGLDDLKKAGRMLATGMAAAGAAIASVGYVVGKEINKTMEYADEVDKLSQKMGLTKEATQEWTFVAEQNGTTLESLTRALGRFQKNVGDADDGLTTATRSFNQLGVEISDSSGQLKTMDEIFPETIRKLSDMEDITKRNQIAMNLFGRGGKELIPILNNTTGEIDDLIEKANDLDLVMSDEDIQSWVNFKDAAHEVTEEFDALRRNLANDFLPFLQTEFLPYIQDTLVPTIKSITDAFSYDWMSFSYEGGEEAKNAINNIEELSKAQDLLQEKQKELSNTRSIEDLSTWEKLSMSAEEKQSLHERRRLLEDEVALLEYRIENWDRLNSKSGDSGGDGGETVVDSGLSDYEKFLQSINEESEKYERNKVIDSIGEDYKKAVKQLEFEKQDKLSLIDTFDISDSKAQKAKEKVKQLYNDMIADAITEGREKWKKEQEKQEKEREEARQQELEAEAEFQEEVYENKYEAGKVSLAEYIDYLKDKQSELKEWSDEWAELNAKINDLEWELGFENETTTDFYGLYKFGQANDQEETGGDTKEQVQSINWMTDAFVDLGLEIEEANQKFVDWKDDLITGLSDAIARGEDLGDVFDNIADQIASMVLQKAVVGPIVNYALGGLNLPTFHEGGFVSPANAIAKMQRYHEGGGIGLKSNEVPAILENGEYVLNKDQVKGLQNGGGSAPINIFDITAIDTQSFAEYVSRNPDAIINVVGRDIMRNGTLRQAIKKS